jgi:ABC-type polysaccharide/polyol phosphate export permease
MAATVLAIVPFCGGAIGAIWSLVICIIGLAEAQRIPVWKAALAVLLPIVLCCCCCAVGAGMFFGSIASLVSHQR